MCVRKFVLFIIYLTLAKEHHGHSEVWEWQHETFRHF